MEYNKYLEEDEEFSATPSIVLNLPLTHSVGRHNRGKFMEWLVGIAIVIVVVAWSSRRRSGNSQTRTTAQTLPSLRGTSVSADRDFVTLHAKPGTFDESYFVSPKTGKFRFPKYRSPRGALVRLVDETPYREDIWQDLDPEEKRDFSVNDFEHYYVSADIDIERFDEVLGKPKNPVYREYPFLKGRSREFETLLMELDDYGSTDNGWPVFADSELSKELLAQGYVEVDTTNVGMKAEDLATTYFETRNVADLRALCKTVGIKVSGKKSELIERLLQHLELLEIPPQIRRADKFEELIESLRQAYISDIRASIDSWHPAVIKDVWETVALDAGENGVEEKAREILKERYWADRCEQT